MNMCSENILLIHKQLHVTTVMHVLSVGRDMTSKGELRCVQMVNGVPYVMTLGALLMLKLSVGSLISPQQVEQVTAQYLRVALWCWPLLSLIIILCCYINKTQDLLPTVVAHTDRVLDLSIWMMLHALVQRVP